MNSIIKHTDLTKNFTYAEVTRSDAADRLGIDNSVMPENLAAIQYTARKMELVREFLGNRPIRVNSWYRNEKVNRAVGGVPNSQHRLGEAVDFTCSQFGSPYDVCVKLQAMATELDFDQLILEPTWTHISFIRQGRPRKQVLTLLPSGTYGFGLIK